jgi:hypothetical protein
MDIRQRLVMAQTVEQFRATLLSAAKELAVDQNQWRERKTSIHLSHAKEQLVQSLAELVSWRRFMCENLATYPSFSTNTNHFFVVECPTRGTVRTFNRD